MSTAIRFGSRFSANGNAIVHPHAIYKKWYYFVFLLKNNLYPKTKALFQPGSTKLATQELKMKKCTCSYCTMEVLLGYVPLEDNLLTNLV